MGFFGIKKPEELKLSDFRDIRTPFCFLDESGTLNLQTQPYFTVGMIKCTQPYYLQQKIRYIRESNKFFFEIKFNGLNDSKLKVALLILRTLFETRDILYSSYTIDKRSEYFKTEFQSDPFVAYEQVAKHLLQGNLGKNEVLIVLADNVVTPKRNKFEVNIKNHINNKFERLAIAGVCRLDSRTNDLLQLTDLLTGAINFCLLVKEGINASPSKAKLEFVKKFEEYLGVKTLAENFRNFSFNIHHHYKDGDKKEPKMKKAIDQ